MKNVNNFKKVILLATILLLPPLVYLLLYNAEHNFNKLPYIGPREAIAKPDGTFDTLYHKIPDFELINQDNKKVTNTDLLGNVYVAEFFFVSCPTICPKMTTNMAYVQKKFKGQPNLRFLSITVNPEADSVGVLKQYAKDVHADNQNWDFVTGDKEKIYQLAFDGFYVNAMEDSIAPGGFLHSEYLILIDKQGHIRGYFDGTIHKIIKEELIDAIDILFREDIVPLKGKKKQTIQQIKD